MQKLHKKRDEALKIKLLVQGPNDYVPGKIRFRNKTLDIKLRLKGDMPDHFDGDKWSFRVHVKGDDHLLGMRRFSLQHPRTRNFENEILYFEALKREGVLVPRYFFTDVYVNGKRIGLMALEEHFSKELLESQGRRESVIIKFDETVWWSPHRDQYLFGNFELAKITPFRLNKISKTKKLSVDLNMARGLLRAFVNRKLPPSKVFDPDLMGRFLAVADAWRAWHQIKGWKNFRFYYNPVTALLEPIGFDGGILKSKYLNEPSPFTSPLVSSIIHGDPRIRSVYKKTIERLAREMDEGITEKWTRPISEQQIGILHKEFLTLKSLDFDLIEKRTRETKQRINATFDMYPEVLQAYIIDEQMGASLELVNPLPHALEVLDIQCSNKISGENLAVDFSVPFTFPLLMNPTPLGDLPKIYTLPYQKPEDDGKCLLRIKVKIIGEEIVRWIDAQLYSPVLYQHPMPEMTLEETLSEHQFLKFDADSKTMSVKSGEWEVTNWIIVPRQIGLKIPQGTILRFNSDSGLLARGGITISGTQQKPVILEALGDPGEKQSWPGIVLMKTQKPSIWSHVKIFKTSGVSKGGWSLTGGVNFYESDIIMDNVSFFGNQSEDALNIIRSKFDLKNITIKNTTSDGFDSDFSRGTIENSRFENIGSQGGGDGVDVSGSEVTVINSYFENISDKGISVGENSNLKATNIDIKNADIGVASKDGSLLSISDSKISKIRKAGLISYIKKTEYGPPEILAKNISIESTSDKFISQNGSKITIDGVETSSVDLDVKKLYSSDVD